jgi:hypothetical protein
LICKCFFLDGSAIYSSLASEFPIHRKDGDTNQFLFFFIVQSFQMKTLVFTSIINLFEFQSIIQSYQLFIDTKTFECSGSFTEAQLELAVNGMNAIVKE